VHIKSLIYRFNLSEMQSEMQIFRMKIFELLLFKVTLYKKKLKETKEI